MTADLRSRAAGGPAALSSTTAASRLPAGATGLGRVRSAAESLQARFLELLLVSRWALVVIGVVIAATRDDREAADFVGGALLGAWALALTLRPHRFDDQDPIWWSVVAVDFALAAGVVAFTNGEDSPYLLSILVPLALLAFTAGRREAVGLAAAAAGTIAATAAVAATTLDERSPGLLAMLFLVGGVIGSLARRAVTEMAAGETATLAEVERLTAANELLQALHAVAQTLPSSFDLDDVVGTVRDRLHEHLAPQVIVLLVRDEATGGWRTELSEGARVPPVVPPAALARSLDAARAGQRVVLVADALSDGARCVSRFARSALHVPLLARGEVIALLAVEHSDARRYGASDAQWVEELAGPLALALDNARWFRRLRRFGAEAERARIARELHDRLAQSLAYVGFELERLAGVPDPDPGAVAELQQVVRQVVTDLRETLFELRVKVTEDQPLAAVVEEFCRRLQQRSGIRVTFAPDGARRLPIPVEQELWLICQEALLNAERHSGTDHILVSWTIGRDAACLEVRDAGQGFDIAANHADHYGLLGMRERAEAIGAALAIDSTPGAGTTIRVRLPLASEGP